MEINKTTFASSSPTPVTPGRTIATDQLSALALLGQRINALVTASQAHGLASHRSTKHYSMYKLTSLC